MKRPGNYAIVISAIAIVAITASLYGGQGGGETWFKGATIDAIEQNLAIALQTPSAGMQASASQVIRDLKSLLPDQEFPRLVIPLMAIVKDEGADVPARMVAALALHELQSSKGDFAIERVAQFTGNERMKHLCSWLTYQRLQKDAPASKAADLVVE